jgi:8-oxo-dGTP pyrophosphatase MutT (NUDIX family)
LYERDREAWIASLAEGNRTQARKRVGTNVIAMDQRGRILLVDPSYKPDWDLPGGMAEANEPPHEAAQRELREELDLDLRMRNLLCVDWVSPHGPWDDSLVFVFDGGTLTEETASSLRPEDPELSAIRFCPLEEAARLLRPYVWRRASQALAALRNGRPSYLHDGNPIQ